MGFVHLAISAIPHGYREGGDSTVRGNFRTTTRHLAAGVVVFLALGFVSMITLCLCYGCNPFPVKGFKKPPSTLKESDLVGTWQTKYRGERIDTITLRADGTYKQVYRQPDGYTYESPWNRWYLEYRDSGWIYVHLEGMRYYEGFLDATGLAESGGRWPPTTTPGVVGEPMHFYDHGEERLIEMLDKVILRVAGLDSVPRGIVLKHMSTSVEAGGSTFFLCRKCDQATPVAQKENLPCCQEDFVPPDDLNSCRNLLLAEDYRLQIGWLDDGTQRASLEKVDGSQIFIHGITRYAIKDNVMVGEIGPQPNPKLWFWFNLDTRDSDRFSTKSEYLAALQELGFEEEPELHSIEFYCEKGDCRPCFGWSPGPTTTSTLSPSPVPTATPAATP
jgi:hypothetical protein